MCIFQSENYEMNYLRENIMSENKVNKNTESRKKGKKKILPKILIALAAVVLLLIVGYIVYTAHMHYDIEPHESYNVADLGENVAYSDVFYTNDISPEGLWKAYEALGATPSGNVAIKLSTGEAGNPNHLDPQLIKELVQSVDGTIVECNTAYSGSQRMETEMHLQVAKDHGFTEIADVDILDRDGYMVIPVDGGRNLKENWVGKNLENYDYVITLTHFKGHPMAGFGGAMKNISIGFGSSQGKVRIHSGGKLKKPTITLAALTTNQDIFTESMAEAAKSVYDYMGHGERIIFINVMNNMSVDCDCVSTPAAVDMADIGIFASLDPVALDQACIDQVFAAQDGGSLQERILSKNGLHILKHAQEIGLGNRAYKLISLDEE